MQTFGATLFGRRRAPRETHPAKTSFLQVPSKHACRLQVGERGQAVTGALGLKASIPEQLSAARDAQQPMHSPHILIPELKPHINTKQCSYHQQCCPGATCSLRRVKSWGRSSDFAWGAGCCWLASTRWLHTPRSSRSSAEHKYPLAQPCPAVGTSQHLF